MSDTQQTSGPLADSDIALLKQFLVTTAVQYLVHGIYTTLVVIALWTLWSNKAHLTSRNILITATLLMFLLTTGGIASSLAFDLVKLPTLGYNPPDISGVVRNIKLFVNVTTPINYLISDLIVVWRAWVICPGHLRLRLVLLLAVFVGFAGALIETTFDALSTVGKTTFNPIGPGSLILTMPMFFMNLVATLVITYKVWEYRSEIKSHIGDAPSMRTKVEQVLILLTESGTIYCLFWLFSMTFSAAQPKTVSLGYSLVLSLLPQLTTLYPIIMILLLVQEKTNLESMITAPTGTSAQSIQIGIRSQAGHGNSGGNHRSTNGRITSVRLQCDAEDGAVTPPEEKPSENVDKVHFAQ
ncbi:hypothetical protein C8J56DRAFT_383016 [Mycena floridula]|nr:hypothetical protein C8J56DRAFT_383016 [Mycena floridula]